MAKVAIFYWRKYLPPLCGGLALIVFFNASGREFYFAPSSLEMKSGEANDVDLSLFSKPGGQLPGTYHSTVLINKQKVDELDVAYISDKKGRLQPQLTPALLRKWGVQIDDYPQLTALPSDHPLASPLGDFIPAAKVDLDFNKMVLRLSLPQAAINSLIRGYIDPSRWDDGVPAAFTDYSLSGTQRNGNGTNNNSQYVNLRNGINLGGWRLRNFSTWSHNEEGNSWQTVNSWLEHDIDALKSQFIAGESSTRADIFDSVQYKGVSLSSDDSMLPYSQRGFAPVIRGIASSNAQVSV